MTRRFFAPDAIDGERVSIHDAAAHRIANVLRLRPGDEILLFGGDGVDARVRLDAVSARAVAGTVVARQPGPAEPRTAVSLYQSVTKGERFDWLVEKATELGASRIVPLITSRAVARPSDGNRLERWRRLAIEAAEQCERSAVPAIEAPVSLAHALGSTRGVLLLPYEDADVSAPTVAAALTSRIDELFAVEAISIFIGPEGGYEPAEVTAAEQAGAIVVSMGQRVMRSETAGMVALTLVMAAIGELGG